MPNDSSRADQSATRHPSDEPASGRLTNATSWSLAAPGTTVTNSQPSTPQLFRICCVAWVNRGKVAYSQVVMRSPYGPHRVQLVPATDTTSPAVAATGWPASARTARLHWVSGKGGTGKSTVAAALALALAAGGNKVLLVEVEGRQGIAQLFDTPPLPHEEKRVAVAADGGEVRALAIDVETALLEYLDMFYNLGFAGRAMRRVGAIEFATTLAPGLRDVLLTGKVKECVVRKNKDGRPTYDAVVVDAPPTGRIVNFLDVTRAMADLAKGGPIRSQSEGVIALLHSEQTAVHLVTLLEELPVQETLDALDELRSADLRTGAVVVNRARASVLSADAQTMAEKGNIDVKALRSGLDAAGLSLSEDDVAGLVTETVQHAVRVRSEQASRARLGKAGADMVELPVLADGVDIGALYELAELLTEQGVR